MHIKPLCFLGVFIAVSLFAADIISFEQGENWQSRIKTSKRAPATVVNEHASSGKCSLKVVFPGSEKDTWPSIEVPITPDDLKNANAIAFSAWHKEHERLALSYRIDFDRGPSMFAGENLLPRSKGKCIVRLKYSDEDGLPRLAKHICIYRRMPRKDSTVWFDDFQFLKDQSTDFKPIEYVPQGTRRSPTPGENALGAQLFQRPWMEHVFTNTYPTVEDPADVVLNAAACPGELEPMTLSVHALRNITSASLAFNAPLKSAAGDSILADAFTVLIINCLDKRTVYASASFYAQIPVVLERLKAAAINAGDTRSFWVEASVPASAKPGLYKGEAILRLDGASKRIPLALRVRSFTLPEPKDMFWGDYYTVPKPKKGQSDADKIREDLSDMRQMGMTSVGLCFAPDISKCSWDGKNATIVLTENRFTLFMECYRALKFPMPVILLNDCGQNFCSKIGLNLESPEYKAAYQAFWKGMQAECAKRGWAELIVQPVDEPGWQSRDSQTRNVILLKYLKGIPGMRTEQDGPGDDYFVNAAGPFADIWNFNGALGSEEIMARLIREKRIPMLYNCDVESYRPVTDRYVAGFYQARSGAKGAFNWAYQSYSGNPYSDFDAKHGGHLGVYPPNKSRPGGPSIGWLSFREGIDDFKYINLLRKLIAANPGPKAEYAAKLLNDILDTIEYNTTVRNAASFQSLPVKDGKARVTGVFNLPNGWLLTDYNKAREVIAGQIEALLAKDGRGAAASTASSASSASTASAVLTATHSATATSHSAQERPAGSYKVSIPKFAKRPVIDGKLNDACWKNAAVLSNFSLNTGGTPKAQTRALIVSDGINLYIAADCEEEFVKMMTLNVGKNQGQVWSDDCIEIFIAPDNSVKGYRQIAVNALGTYCTLSSTHSKWQPKLETAGTRAKDRWFVEVAIPLTALKLKGDSFGFNVCRERRPLEVMELTCWSPTGVSFGNQGRFGTATMGKAWLREVNVDTLRVGNGSISIGVMNPAADKTAVTVKVAWKSVDGTDSGTARRTVIPGKGTSTINIPVKLSSFGECEVLVTVLDSRGTEVERQIARCDVPSPVSLTTLSPFTGKGWTFTASVEFVPAAGEKMNLKLFALSNPAAAVTLYNVKPGDGIFTGSLLKGAFAPVDAICAELREANSGRILGIRELKIFAP